ncbi:recombinase family protein [Micrococcus terreus]|uniref:recombinase family protein n=1 Tax=Micrococcus terreus TaxID=574650 RepID=UPI003D756208
MTVYGYGRVSTKLQDLEAQIAQIEGYGVDRSCIEHEIISSRKQKREALERVLAEVSEGDTLHVVKLDRLGRDMDELGAVGRFLEEKKVKLGIGGVIHDPTTFEGRTLFLVLSMVAEIERELIAERTRDKLARKRANGEQIGRKPALTKRQRSEAAKAFEAGLSKSQIAGIYGVARATVAKAILESSDEERIESDPELRKTIRAQEKEEREAVRRLEAAKRAADKEKSENAVETRTDAAQTNDARLKREK